MKRSEKVERILRILDGLYPDPPIPLDHGDPFTLLIAVLLSAQTTDAQVNRVTPELFRRASNPNDMAQLDVSEIHHCIRSCGLATSKARNISRLSRILLSEYGGRVPNDPEILESLPGVGHKTASVVLAQAFRRNAFPVDTHIHRLAWRWGLSNGRNVAQTERDLKKAFPEHTWNRLHLQMIYFGREHCPALRHNRNMSNLQLGHEQNQNERCNCTMKVIITCPRCDESGDPDSSIYDDAFTPATLQVGGRFSRESTDDPFHCTVCEKKGVYCEAETSEV